MKNVSPSRHTTPKSKNKKQLELTRNIDLLFDLSKYSLDHQWDVYKHNEIKSTTIAVITVTIFSLFLGVQIKEFGIIGIMTKLSCMQNIVATLLFIFIMLCLIVTIYYNLLDLGYFRVFHIDPIESISRMKNMEESKSKPYVIINFARLWFKNQYFIGEKNKYRRRAFKSLIIAIISMVPSFIASELC